MERETRELKGNEAYRIAGDWLIDDLNYVVVERKITGSDHEDGGASHEVILKEKTTGKFFKFYYCEWDIENTDYDEEKDEVIGGDGFEKTLSEVFPETITRTVYR